MSYLVPVGGLLNSNTKTKMIKNGNSFSASRHKYIGPILKLCSVDDPPSQKSRLTSTDLGAPIYMSRNKFRLMIDKS
uniref:Uncharacterized protein n=1 Tax=Romanomermis culicivorax TaxID=13658 RepID=A0A915L579_ROMCU